MAFQRLLHEGERGRLVTGLGDKTLENLTLLVYPAAEANHLAVELHVHIIEMPAQVPEALHPVDPLSADVCSKQRTEPVPP